MLEEEFPTLVDLRMSLHAAPRDVLPHWNRILSALDLEPAALFGPDNQSLHEAHAHAADAP